MSDKRAILDSLEPLFTEAKAKGLFFRSNYQGFLLSPDELRKEHANGRLIWGPVNWELVDPRTKSEELKEKIKSAENELANWNRKIGL